MSTEAKCIFSGVIGAILAITFYLIVSAYIDSDNPRRGEYESVFIGHIGAVKLDSSKYVLSYKSRIDKVRTKAEVLGEFELGQVKSIIDAATDKKFKFILINKSCLMDLISKMYEGKAYDESHCDLYGSYKIALEAYDRDLYIDELIHKSIIRIDEYAKIVKRD